ncbi:hypothetical protein AaE_002105 [Aphanomyces astaci]|uniref:Uncharacterized protein n=1 Tax=Aphanomyces astaci TaxID=112090 RepID=A0A6A5AUZ3_APHAT|nr:hypothetical protein AaE_002105 [Aphanomyces astaci]
MGDAGAPVGFPLGCDDERGHHPVRVTQVMRAVHYAQLTHAQAASDRNRRVFAQSCLHGCAQQVEIVAQVLYDARTAAYQAPHCL